MISFKVGKGHFINQVIPGSADTLNKWGKEISSPEARALAGGLAGGILGGPAGAAAGVAAGLGSSEKGREFLKRATTMPGQGGLGKAGTAEQQQAQSLSEAIGQQYGDVSKQGIAAAQAMQAPTMAPTAQAAGLGAALAQAPQMQAAQMQASQEAQAAQMAPATQVSPGFQQYIAGLSPEQMQGAQLERTAAAGPAQIQAAEEGRTFQQALAQQLMGQATGQAPSLAEVQLQQAQDRALKQQIAQAASVRGGPAAAAQQRQLGAQLAEMQQANIAQATEARIKEQQAAQQTLGQVAGTMRAGDVELATEQARLEQQAALEGRKLTSEEARTQAGFIQEAKRANQAAINDLTNRKAELMLRAQQGDQQAITELQTVQAKLDTEVNIDNARRVDDAAKQQTLLEQQARMGNQAAALELQKLNAQLTQDLQKFNASEANQMARADAETKAKYEAQKNDLIKYYTSLGYESKQAEVKTMLDIASLKMGQARDKAAAEQAKIKTGIDIISGLGTAATAMAPLFAASDINVKTNIKETSLLKDLAKTKAYEYDYKDSKYGTGKQHSLMAQDIEKVPFLQKIIFEQDNVKMVDYGKALPSMLAVQSEMAREILDLKKKLRGK